jgi:hypothetical protein
MNIIYRVLRAFKKLPDVSDEEIKKNYPKMEIGYFYVYEEYRQTTRSSKCFAKLDVDSKQLYWTTGRKNDSLSYKCGKNVL